MHLCQHQYQKHQIKLINIYFSFCSLLIKLKNEILQISAQTMHKPLPDYNGTSNKKYFKTNKNKKWFTFFLFLHFYEKILFRFNTKTNCYIRGFATEPNMNIKIIEIS